MKKFEISKHNQELAWEAEEKLEVSVYCDPHQLKLYRHTGDPCDEPNWSVSVYPDRIMVDVGWLLCEDQFGKTEEVPECIIVPWYDEHYNLEFDIPGYLVDVCGESAIYEFETEMNL